MNYKIWGQNLPAVTLDLDAGESIYTQSGGMAWMTDGIEMSTNMKGGFFKGIGRLLAGESLFMATYTAKVPNSSITIASSFPGSIMTLEVNKKKEYICQKNAFLCAEPNVHLSAEVVKGLSGGLFGGEGFVLQKLSGQGLAFIEIDGSVAEYDLGPNESIKVDTGNVAAFESSVSYNVETVKGFKNVLFGGEGLFLTRLTGPGKVWLQTMTIPAFAQRLIPFLPNKGNSGN